MMTEKKKYFYLMGEVCEILKATAVDDAVRAGYEPPSNLLDMIRIGCRPVLRDLVALVQSSLSDFEIPAQ